MFVLIVGYRQQLAAALSARNIAYAVWSDKPIKKPPKDAKQIIIQSFPKDREIAQNNLNGLPTHVIAGTEAAVFPASRLRRFYNARKSPDTLLVRCTDKLAMKEYLSNKGISMTKFQPWQKGVSAAEIIRNLGLPLVLKTRKGSGGRDLVLARTVADVEQNLGPGVLCESCIEGEEGSVESFIENGQIRFASVTEYYRKKEANIVPARYSDEEMKSILEANSQAIKALKIKWGLTHLEFYRTKSGILFGEIALRPPGGYIMELIQLAHGFDPWIAFVEVELGLELSLPDTSKNSTAGVCIVHSGSGTIKRIQHLDNSAFKSLVRKRISVRPGETIDERKSVGEECGHFIFCHDKCDTVVQDLDTVLNTTIFEMEQE